MKDEDGHGPDSVFDVESDGGQASVTLCVSLLSQTGDWVKQEKA